MEIRFSKESLKFLDKLDSKTKEKVREKLQCLLEIAETQGVIPFQELDMKQLKGDWKGFLRMRIGKVRIIFIVDSEAEEILIYDIDSRGSIYKKISIKHSELVIKAE